MAKNRRMLNCTKVLAGGVCLYSTNNVQKPPPSD